MKTTPKYEEMIAGYKVTSKDSWKAIGFICLIILAAVGMFYFFSFMMWLIFGMPSN